jgi:DNA-binding transcriptional ArsR family regulator
MDRKSAARYHARARIIKAMAHPTRLFIVDELSKHEWCVCELTEMIGADTSTVSRHLSILKGAGIIQDEKRGANVYYRLRVPCVLNFFDCVEAVMRTSADEQLHLVDSK